MRLKWKTREYKDYLWNYATTTTILEFKAIIQECMIYNKQAYEWLLKIPPHHCVESHFLGSKSKSDPK